MLPAGEGGWNPVRDEAECSRLASHCTGNLRTMCECVDSHFCVSSVQTAMVLSSTDWENVSHVLRWLQGAFTQM